MTTIGFLHTSPVHEPTFERLAAELAPDAQVATVVDELLLDRARAVGLDHVEVIGAIADRLAQLSDADVVVCTCSTIGGVAELVGAEAGLEVVRVDRPMAERAVLAGGRVTVLAAVESTLGPTGELIEESAARLGVAPAVDLVLVDGAWAHFEAGDTERYLDTIASAITSAAVSCDVVVLAQASMAAVADRVKVAVPVLSSPRLAVESIAERLG